MVKRALIHVENTENLIELARYLDIENWTILSANQTEDILRKNKITVTHEPGLDSTNVFISEISRIVEEILDTSEETLLHTSENENGTHGNNGYVNINNINKGISLVCINVNPILHEDLPEHQIKSVINNEAFPYTTILRESVLNNKNVLILTDPADYQEAIIQLRTGNITSQFRNYLAAKALNLLSAYDSGIAASILRSPSVNEQFMNYLMLPLSLVTRMNVGINAHQEAGIYKYPYNAGALSGLSQLTGEELNYNIASDVSAAWELISILYTNLKSQFTVKSVNADGYEFTTQFTPLTGTVFTVAIKFGMVVGGALSTSVVESFKNTYVYEKSITGVSLGCSSVIDEQAAKEIVQGNFIAIIAPGYTDEAREILSTNKKIKLITTSRVIVSSYEGRLINGGLLMQRRDTILYDYWQVRTKTRPSQQITDEMAFGTLLSMGSHSYSALFIKNHHIVGIAQSCTTTQKALEEAMEEAIKTSKDPNTPVDDSLADILVCGSPIEFTDSIKKIIDSGIYGIIQPGGTSTDDELIQYCNERGIVMVCTGMTHYNY